MEKWDNGKIITNKKIKEQVNWAMFGVTIGIFLIIFSPVVEPDSYFVAIAGLGFVIVSWIEISRSKLYYQLKLMLKIKDSD